VKKAAIHRRADPAVFKGSVAYETAAILLHQAVLARLEAFCASGSLVRGKKANNRKPFLQFKGLFRFG
jgi:hypothetical protein